MFNGLKSGDAGGLFGLLSSSNCFFQSSDVLRLSLSTKFKPEGEACLWRMVKSISVVSKSWGGKTAPDLSLPTTSHCGISPLIYFLIVSMFTMLDLPHFWSHLYTHRSLQWCQYHGVHDAHLSKMSSNVCRFKIIKQQPSVKMPGL